MNKKAIRHYHHLMGMIEFEIENYSKAIAYIKEAVSLLPYQYIEVWFMNAHALLLYSLALANFKSGDLDKAREVYERITTLTTGRIHYGDLYVKSYYMLGKIYEEQGNTAKAIEHYKKFLDLWKDADPGLAEVDDAKEALKRLKKD